MRLKKINILILLLLTVILSAAAQKETKDIDEWTENASFGQNGDNLTAVMFSGSYNPGEGSDPNAIEPVVRTIDRNGTQRVFDLSGRPINGNVKGIVIRNGLKVVR